MLAIVFFFLFLFVVLCHIDGLLSASAARDPANQPQTVHLAPAAACASVGTADALALYFMGAAY
jgi:Na+-transporting methylmalonyl-CoA/oxaloacetate decarboxylase gamma subunit